LEARQPLLLIVEDNLLIAMEVEAMAEDCGCAIAGPAGSVSDALEVIEANTLTGAILDVNLGDERVWPVAEKLALRTIPFVLATGYGDAEIPAQFKERPILSKPISRGSLAKALRETGIIS
jgi:CheY-like chemotaxis protein